MTSFTHFNEQGRANMVDISNKADTQRIAIAFSQIKMPVEVYEKIEQKGVKKGDVLAVAQVAGIMAAKNTSQLIPMCHLLSLSGVDIHFNGQIHDQEAVIEIEAKVKNIGKTGVEMEALTAASVTALTIYDMCKSMGQSMTIGPTYLLEKQGGKSGTFKREQT